MLKRVCLPNRHTAGLLHNSPEACLEHIVFHPEDLDWGWIQFEGRLPPADEKNPASSSVWAGISWDLCPNGRRGTRTSGVWSHGDPLFQAITDDVSFVRYERIPLWGRAGTSFIELVALRYLAQDSSLQCTEGLRHVSHSTIHAKALRQDEEMSTTESFRESTTESAEEPSSSVRNDDFEVPLVGSLWDIPVGARVEQEYRLVGFEDHAKNFLVASKLLKIPALCLSRSIIRTALPESLADTTLPVRDKASVLGFMALCAQTMDSAGYNSSSTSSLQFPVISLFSHLQSLDLSHNNHLLDIREVFKIVSLCPRLQTLSLNNNPHLFKAAIPDCLRDSDTPRIIKHLNLSSNLTPSSGPEEVFGLLFLARRLLALEGGEVTLVLSNNHLTQETGEMILGALCQTPSKIAAAALSVDFSHNCLEDMSQLVRKSVSLARLNLAWNPLRWNLPESLTTQSPALELKSLNVDGCNLSSWDDFYWICAFAPNLEEMRCAKNLFLTDSSRHSEHWVRDRYKRWAFLKHLKSMDGELLTPAMKVEAQRYTASLLERGLDFINVMSVVDWCDEQASAQSPPPASHTILHTLLANLFQGLDRNLSSTIARLQAARRDQESVVNDLKTWLPHVRFAAHSLILPQSLKAAMALRPMLVTLTVCAPLLSPDHNEAKDKSPSPQVMREAADIFNASPTSHWVSFTVTTAPTLTTVEDLKVLVAARTRNWALTEFGAVCYPSSVEEKSQMDPVSPRKMCTCSVGDVQSSKYLVLEPDIRTLDFFGLGGNEKDDKNRHYVVLISGHKKRQEYNAASIYSADDGPH